ncbi:MAG: pyridoxamine 5'-phosphate oxidase family protein [Acidimicrobiales bacterium]
MTRPAHLATVEELSPDDCRDYLRSARIGRLAVHTDGHPDIFPVSFVFDSDSIIFRTEPGTKLSAASMARVALETDQIDMQAGTAWSVVVKGMAFDITDAIDPTSQRARAARVDSAFVGDDARWVRISGLEISGRRLSLIEPSTTTG